MKIGYGDYFIIYLILSDVKVKELIIKPKKGMSFQRHKERNEIWLVSKGSCEVLYSKIIQIQKIKKF